MDAGLTRFDVIPLALLSRSKADHLLPPDPSWIYSVAVSPDGKLVAAGSLDAVVRLWDAHTGVQLGRFLGHSNSVYSVAFSPDGSVRLSPARLSPCSVSDSVVLGSNRCSALDRSTARSEFGTCRQPRRRARQAQRSTACPTERPAAGSAAVRRSSRDTRTTFSALEVRPASLLSPSRSPLPSAADPLSSTMCSSSLAVTNDGRWVVSGSKDRGVQFYDTKSKAVQLLLQGHKNSGASPFYPF